MIGILYIEPMNYHEQPNNAREYLKFSGVIAAITALSIMHALVLGFDLMQFLESFMGVFFIIFAGFKLYSLKEFALGFQSYDIIAKRSLKYSYAYPFLQLLFGIAYLLGLGTLALDGLVLLISLVSGLGVVIALRSKQDVHCVCLGNVIKLPLSTISFVEDFGMAGMALAMILLR